MKTLIIAYTTLSTLTAGALLAASALADGSPCAPSSSNAIAVTQDIEAVQTKIEGQHVCQKPAIGKYTKQKGWYISAQGELVTQKPPTVDASGTHENYELILNLKFDANGAKGDDKTIKEKAYHDYTAHCWSELSRFLKGPDGENLTLRFPDTDEENHSAPSSTVSVKNDCGIRSDANCWNAGVTCSTIWHETLHRLGLFDEYQEQDMGGAVHDAHNNLIKAGWNCRAIGRDDSIMNNQLAAAGSLYPQYKVTVMECKDGATDAEQKQCVANLDQAQKSGAAASQPVQMHQTTIGFTGFEKPIGSADPDVEAAYEKTTLNNNLSALKKGYKIELAGMGPEDFENYAKDRTAGKRVSPLRYEKVEVIPPRKTAALSPSEFTAILFPTCGINNLFYQCGRFVDQSGGCSGQPPLCKQKDVWTALPAGQIP